ncbi:MAG: DHA2 family efflux MFS transporter permease subunit [Phycisphaerales bacterium]
MTLIPPPHPPAQAGVKRLLPWVVAVALFMESLDTTILNTGVPTIAASLGVAALSMKAALTSYTISLAIFIPISGWIADRYGTRRVFFSAMGVFTLGSLCCGLSTSMPLLVASRVLQGAGGALMMPVGRIAMVRTFPKSELLRATTFVAIPALVGPLLGPLVGGFIVTYLHWRVIFFVNLPIGLAGIVLAYLRMPDYRVGRRDPLDLVGLVLFGGGIGLLSYVLEVFGEHALSVQSMAWLFALSIALLGAYGAHSVRHAFPLLRLSLFRVRTFRVAVVGGFITRLGAGGMPFMLPLLYQVGLGFTPVQSGLLIMPQPLAALGLRYFTARILARFGYRWVLLVNTLCMGLLILLFMTVTPGASAWFIAGQAAFFGFASSVQYTSMGTLTFADLSDADTSMGSSIASTVQQMSMSFGVAVASLLTVVFIGTRQAHVAGMIGGIHRTFLTLGLLTIASSLMFWQLRGEDGANVSGHGGVEG